MSRSYTKDLCDYCDELVSNAGAARVAHLRGHVRAGLLEERKVGGRVLFDATVKGRAERLRLSDERTVRQAAELAHERGAKSYEAALELLAADLATPASPTTLPAWLRRWWKARHEHVADAFRSAWERHQAEQGEGGQDG